MMFDYGGFGIEMALYHGGTGGKKARKTARKAAPKKKTVAKRKTAKRR